LKAIVVLLLFVALDLYKKDKPNKNNNSQVMLKDLQLLSFTTLSWTTQHAAQSVAMIA
jgi:hypothetical protein